ncbi:MAG: hypothetical protein JWN04_4888 [Myxococcaceae bacterium]|nr:hypothetical protein [Myxococcaceae bacterium]
MLAETTASHTHADERIEWELVEEHLDEADYLLGTFVRTLDSPVQCLAQLAEHPEESLLNHLDALVVAGPLARERLVVPALAKASVGAPMRVAAAAMVAIAAQACDALWPALDHAHHEIRGALVWAVRLAGRERFDDWLRSQLARQQTTLRHAGLLELAAARQLAPAGLMASLQDDDAAVVAGAARAARYGDGSVHAPVMEYLLNHSAQDVRDAALVASLAWGSGRAWDACERAALDRATTSVARDLYAALGGSEQHQMLIDLLTEPSQRASTLRALGFTGSLQVVPCLLEALHSGTVREAKLAAQSLSMILGIDLLDPALSLAAPTDGAESPASLPDDDLDAELVPTPEDELPRPNPAALERACTVRLASAKQHPHLLDGVPFSSEQVLRSLELSPLGRRDVLALVYGIRTGGAAWLDTHTLSHSQQVRMTSLRALSSKMNRGPYLQW